MESNIGISDSKLSVLANLLQFFYYRTKVKKGFTSGMLQTEYKKTFGYDIAPEEIERILNFFPMIAYQRRDGIHDEYITDIYYKCSGGIYCDEPINLSCIRKQSLHQKDT